MGAIYFMTLREQWQAWLKEDEWRTKRTEIMMRDNFKCQIGHCPAHPDYLQVHHLYYIHGLKPWEYSNDCLITLCGKHHAEYHKRVEDAEKRLCLTLKTKGFMLGDLLSLSTILDNKAGFAKSLLKTLRDFQDG